MTRLLPLLAVLTALAPLSVDIYTPSLPAMQDELGGADWLAQASITTFLLGIGIGQLVWGPLSDRHGRRPVVLAGVAGWTVASLLSALAFSPEMLVGVRLLAGLCGAAGIAVARSIVRDVSDDTSTMASRIGMLAMVTALAPVLAPVLGAGLAHVWGWRADFVTLAGLGGVIVLLFSLAVPETLPREHRTPGGPSSVVRALARAAHHREVRGAALSLGVHSFGFYAYIASASFIVERELGHPPAVFALVFGTNAVAVILGNTVFRRAVRSLHPAGPLGVGYALCTIAGLGLLIAASGSGAPAGVLWACAMVYAFGQGLVLPGAHSWGQTTVVASGAASALTGSAQFLGGVLGSPMTGLIGISAAHLGAVLAAASGAAGAVWLLTRSSLSPSPTPASSI
ncbi:multidrug effflux MFS transporter [Demequina sp. SYSU T00039]|uniref:Multidrug effflux MFS transporter n=1 Tax=Demequina lignilytica TaxID=3051663 RepID=A0AAW7M905_9MICO|nr:MULTISPECIES: multidrug effflux MFS transporter [unclassified Demequina]MDN4478978.1 multidrug effflux MFS transporter [Demequina sp. SYSU T00039-1]MDN4488853.1 multidrug effflux MFS transporter [Demequina sp. SYSU T00039]MDN4491434.1 multidrug effflux MFS transporter [Demequina sp. SYSU T00068]